ncbi:MAG: DUF2157 domain-containing protein [Leptospirales bacterium]|nr:DUF2157 domain-containing protein [Leptospirales bacterium]
MNRIQWIETLLVELTRWPQRGLIDGQQSERIAAEYRSELQQLQAAAKARSGGGVRIRLPAILIGMAALLIGLGLILFYSANWAAMSPTSRLIQILAALVAIHSATFVFYFVRPHPLAARGLLLIGLLAFGAAIGLVAQIYHISAHPTNGLLLWLAVSALLSLLLLERWGLYASLLLSIIWYAWERGEYDHLSPHFLIFPLLLGFAFWKIRDRIGLWLCSLTLPLYALFSLAYWSDSDASGVILIAALAAGGALLLSVARLPGDEITALSQQTARLLGWVFCSLPAMLLAWPLKLEGGFALVDAAPLVPRLLLAAFWLSALGLTLWQRRSGAVYLQILALLLALLPLSFPIQNQAALVAVMHTALLALLAGLLFLSYFEEGASGVDRAAAFLIAIVALFSKAIGLFALAVSSSSAGEGGVFYIAYNLGFLLFASVAFMINELTATWLPERPGRSYPGGVLRAIIGAAVFLFLYAISFKPGIQDSIQQAGGVVLALIALFAGVALALFGAAYYKVKERLPAGMAFGIFALTLLMLFVSGPHTPVIVYQLIFNFMLLAFSGLALLYSVRINSAALANAAIGAFALHAATRVIDTFWDLLSGSLLFITCGVLLFALGMILERQRRRLLAQMEQGEAKHG